MITKFKNKLKNFIGNTARIESHNALAAQNAEKAAIDKMVQAMWAEHPSLMELKNKLTELDIMKLNIKTLGYAIGEQLYKNYNHDASTPPEKTKLKSKLCTQSDIHSDWYAFWSQEIKSAEIYHRKIWEFNYISQALYSNDMLAANIKGLGFGCGQEPLPSLFAKYGVKITATDLSEQEAQKFGWTDSKQHSKSLEILKKTNICPDVDKLNNIELEYVDMNQIPERYHDSFDFCWSSCSLEHLGSIQHGLDFIENAMKVLKPGGIAVHTTEFNLNAKGPTIDSGITVLFQEQHIRQICEKLTKAGHQVAELDFSPGTGVLDSFIDIPPYTAENLGNFNHLSHIPEFVGKGMHSHLRLAIGQFTCTSIGIIIKKKS